MCIATDFYMFNCQENLRFEVMNQGKIREYIVVLHDINKTIYLDAPDKLQQQEPHNIKYRMRTVHQLQILPV